MSGKGHAQFSGYLFWESNQVPEFQILNGYSVGKALSHFVKEIRSPNLLRAQDKKPSLHASSKASEKRRDEVSVGGNEIGTVEVFVNRIFQNPKGYVDVGLLLCISLLAPAPAPDRRFTIRTGQVAPNLFAADDLSLGHGSHCVQMQLLALPPRL